MSLGSGAAEVGERVGEEGLSEWFPPHPARNFHLF